MAKLEERELGSTAANPAAKGAVTADAGAERSRVGRWIELVAGMSGLFVYRFTPIRVFVTATIVAAWAVLTLCRFHPSHAFALASFVGLFVVRYLFLFYSFTPRGIASWLKARFGRAQAFSIYEGITACFFAARSLTFAWLLEASAIQLAPVASNVLVILGLVLAAIGMIVNIWAASVVGLGTYYYGDLFMGDAPVDFKVAGPYRFWKNPMYGIGQLGAYGAALMALSPLGLVAGLLNQLTMYLFNWLIEQPHLRRALA
jgi:hypothetical protein